MARLEYVSGPATDPSTGLPAEPITLALAKAQCNVDSSITAFDALITQYITAARETCEGIAHQRFILQTYDLWLDYWDRLPPSSVVAYFGRATMTGATIYNDWWKTNQIRLPLGPVLYPDPTTGVSPVQFVRYTDTDGNLQTWDPSNYVVSYGKVARVSPVQNGFFPSVSSQVDAVQIRFDVGYGTDGTTTPGAAKQAILLLVAHYFRQRAAATPMKLEDIPQGVVDLIDKISVGDRLFI